MIVKNIFSILAIYALTFGLFFAPIIEVNVGGPNTRYLAMGFFAFFSLLHIFRLGLLTLTSFELSIIFLSIIVFSLSLFNWDALSTPGSYISLVLVGFLIGINNSAFFEKILLYILILSIFIALFEYTTGEYLYVVKTNVNGVDFEIDEKLLSGGSNIFRAKGLFEGPLTFAQFLVFMALIFFRSKFILLLCIFGAFLTASRMSIFVIICVNLIHYVFSTFSYGSGKVSKKYLTVFFMIVLTTPYLMLTVLSFFGTDFIDRLYEGITFAGGSNSARLFFWVSGIEFFLLYDPLDMLLGSNGSYRAIYNNNAESGWITLLVDNGILGFLIYFVPCIVLMFWGVKVRKLEYVLFGFVYILVNFTMTFYLSASGNILFWYALFKWIREAKS